MTTVPEPRPHFPALAGGFSFLDNAAGAQVPAQCIDAIRDFLSAASCNVGQEYPGSMEATRVKDLARAETAAFLHCSADEVVLGPNATTLSFRLAHALGRRLGSGDQIIVSELEHEANASPYRALARLGVELRVWRARFPEGRLHTDDLAALLTPRTRLVTLTAAANSIGTVPDVAAAAALCHERGALLAVDAVHASPHILPDVRAWDADFAFFSTYKTFGPHLGCLFVRGSLLESLPVDTLYFMPENSPTKLELGTSSHECLAGWLGTLRYLRHVLGGRPEREGPDEPTTREDLVRAYRAIAAIEAPLCESTLEALLGLPRIRLHGIPEPRGRVATFCVSVDGASPADVASHLARHGIGVATGDYYAPMVLDALGLAESGAVRISFAHYNTRDDVDRLIAALRSL